jgi:hypothetical protein
MICPGKQSAAWLTGPQRQGGSFPVYTYYFVHTLLIVDIVDLFKPLGCFHGSELVNVFDLSIAMLGPGEPELGKQFVRYWVNFGIK